MADEESNERPWSCWLRNVEFCKTNGFIIQQVQYRNDVRNMGIVGWRQVAQGRDGWSGASKEVLALLVESSHEMRRRRRRRHNSGCVQIHSFIISNKHGKVLKLIKAPL
jgi:hypothetical protein